MEKKQLKKLSLGKETVSHLSAESQRGVKGGANEPSNDSCAPYGTCETQSCELCNYTQTPVCEFTIRCAPGSYYCW